MPTITTIIPFFDAVNAGDETHPYFAQFPTPNLVNWPDPIAVTTPQSPFIPPTPITTLNLPQPITFSPTLGRFIDIRQPIPATNIPAGSIIDEAWMLIRAWSNKNVNGDARIWYMSYGVGGSSPGESLNAAQRGVYASNPILLPKQPPSINQLYALSKQVILGGDTPGAGEVPIANGGNMPLTVDALNDPTFYVRYQIGVRNLDGGTLPINIDFLGLQVRYTTPETTARWFLNLSTATAGTPDAGNTIAGDPAPGGDGKYADLSVVEVESNTASGYVFEGFSGDLTGTTNPQDILMNSDKNVVANFRQEVTLVVETDPDPAPGGSSFTLTPPGGNYLFGDLVDLAVTPPSGFTATLTVDTPSTVSIISQTGLTWTLSLTGNGQVTIQYVPLPYVLTVASSGPGTVDFGLGSPDQFATGPNSFLQVTALFGEEWFFEATPNAGAIFVGWANGLTGTTNPDSLTIAGNTVVVAIFTIENIELTIDITGEGEVNATPPNLTVDETDVPEVIPYNLNTVVTLTATPAAGWIFDRWEVDLLGSANPSPILMDSDKTVRAVFIQDDDPKGPEIDQPPRNRWWETRGPALYLRGTV